MRSSTYVFLGLSAICALTLKWGVANEVFSYGAALIVAVLFAVSAAISLENAITAYRRG